MKRIVPVMLMASMLILALCGMTAVPEDVETRQNGEKMEIIKVYHLSPEEDPQLLIEEPFEQDGYEYQYQSMVKEETINQQSKLAEKELTFSTDTNKLEEILPDIPGSIPYDGEDEYEGNLVLNPSSIQTEAEGYASSSYTVSDTRTYTNLPYNDKSLIPQTVEKNGMTLTLAGVSWQGVGGTGANGSLIPTSYTATASYSAVGSRSYATGYITTARYSGDVTLTTEDILYTLTYSGEPIPPPEPDRSWIVWTLTAIFAVSLGASIVLAVLYFRGRRRLRQESVIPPAEETQEKEERNEANE